VAGRSKYSIGFIAESKILTTVPLLFHRRSSAAIGGHRRLIILAFAVD
jgi:hypothetical protein